MWYQKQLCIIGRDRRWDQAIYGVTKQILTPEEEESIENLVLEIQLWGFPPRMAKELLQAKGDYKELGIN